MYYASTATHYDLKAVALEAFARPLWALSSLLAGGGEYDGAERWIRGLASGTDPKSQEYWGGAKAKDQRMVEMSPLSFAICMAPEVFYEVSPDMKQQADTRTKPTRPSRTLLLSFRLVLASLCRTPTGYGSESLQT